MGGGLFNRPVAFGFCFCLYAIFQVSVGVYIAGILTTLEKQYRIKSSVSGLILSTSDFASLVSLLVVTYVGQKWHRPRIVGICALLTGVGGFLSGLPHFLYPAYREGDASSSNGTSSVFVCDVNRDTYVCTADDIDDSGSRLYEAWAIFLGQALMGMANAPIIPIAITYIDDQVKGTTTPYYIAAFLIMSTSATLVGFGEGFFFLLLSVNWPAETDPTQEWIGAWWLGFFVDGIIIIILSIPFFFFPKKMDIEIDEEDIPKDRLAITKTFGESSTKLGAKDFLGAVKRVTGNFVFVMLACSNIFELAIGASFAFFLPKFLQIQYDVNASFSALFVGIIIMPAALIANLTSGILVKKLKLTSKGLGRLLVIQTVLVMCCIPAIYFLSCPEVNFSGYTDGILITTQDCNKNCNCTMDRYEPVCGANREVYATPCLAGCTGERQNRTDDPNVNITVYTGCICSAEDGNVGGATGDAVQGKCLEPCNMLYYAIVLLFGIVLFGSVIQNPLLTMEMRATGEDKTFALGIATWFGRALGFLPAPIYFGAFLDGACILERNECGVTGDCLIYNAQQFRLIFLSIFFALKVFNLFFYSIATVKATRNQNKLEREDAEGNFETKYGAVLKESSDGEDNKWYIKSDEKGAQTDLPALLLFNLI